MNDTSILIVAFYYPPYPKVGSRRWVKFAKYLQRHNKNIHVLAAKMDVDTVSPWDKDAKEVENRTTILPFKYAVPYFKLKTPNNFNEKIRWFLSKWLNNFKISKPFPGNPSDNSEIHADTFLKAIKNIIDRKNVSTIIFTATPNHLAFHISTLKKEYKNVKFVFDLRDYWSDWMQHLSKDQYQYELKLEKETIKNADLVYSPAQTILDTLKARYPEKASAFKVLPHAFDPDDFDSITESNIRVRDSQIIHLVYAGTMYDAMEGNMEVLADLLKRNTKVHISFYTFTSDYKEFFENEIKAQRVKFINPLPIKEFTNKMFVEADAMLYMRSGLNGDNNFLSTKFFDFLPLKKPIIYLGDEGDALKFILEEHIGFHLNKNSIDKIQELIDLTNKTVKDLDVNSYSFESVTQQLEKDLEN